MLLHRFHDNKLSFDKDKNFIKVLKEEPLWGVRQKFNDDFFEDCQNICEDYHLPILSLCHGKEAPKMNSYINL